MGFARKMRKKQGSGLIEAMLSDEHFGRAMRFDEEAIEMIEGEKHVCRFDGKPLEFVRSVSISLWDGRQDQLECSGCSKKYVQFVPDQEEGHGEGDPPRSDGLPPATNH